MADQVVRYSGRGPAPAGSVTSWLDDWRMRNWCGRGARTRLSGRRGARVVRAALTCRRATIEHITLEGTDHGWPGSGGPFPEHDPTGLSASREVLRFFARFPPVPGSHG